MILAAAWLAGCSTPDKRIQKAPEIFAALPAEQQELVKQGRVAPGFSADAVLLALGDPDRRWTRTDAKGTRDVWSYVTWENGRGQPLYRGWYHASAGGWPLFYASYPDRREKEYLKVIFGLSGKVEEVEQAVAN